MLWGINDPGLLPELFLARGGSSDGRRGESDIWQNQQTAVWCCRWGEISQGNSFCSKSFCSSYVECAVTVFSDTHTRFRFFPNFEWTLNYEEYLDIWICKLIIKPPLLGIHLQLQLLFPAWDGDVVAHTGLVHEGLPPSQSQANGFTNKSRSFENPFSFTLSSLHLSLCVQRADRTIEAWTDMTAKRGWRLPLSPFSFCSLRWKEETLFILALHRLTGRRHSYRHNEQYRGHRRSLRSGRCSVRYIHTVAISISSLLADMLSKEEFQLKQNVEPFIHYKEKLGAFECITRENIEAVAAKVRWVCAHPSAEALSFTNLHICHVMCWKDLTCSCLNPSHQGKHCLLEAELSCVKDLLRREIYPIIIFIKICERNVKKLRYAHTKLFPVSLTHIWKPETFFYIQIRDNQYRYN